jgi:hypothetical protein
MNLRVGTVSIGNARDDQKHSPKVGRKFVGALGF